MWRSGCTAAIGLVALLAGPVPAGAQDTGDRFGVAVLDAETGRDEWRRTLDPPWSFHSPAITRSSVVLGVSRCEEAAEFEPRVVAFDRSTGERKWTRRDLEGPFTGFSQYDQRVGPPPAARGIVVARNRPGEIVGLDATTGRTRWRAATVNRYTTVTSDLVIGSADVQYRGSSRSTAGRERSAGGIHVKSCPRRRLSTSSPRTSTDSSS